MFISNVSYAIGILHCKLLYIRLFFVWWKVMTMGHAQITAYSPSPLKGQSYTVQGILTGRGFHSIDVRHINVEVKHFVQILGISIVYYVILHHARICQMSLNHELIISVELYIVQKYITCCYIQCTAPVFLKTLVRSVHVVRSKKHEDSIINSN